MKRVLASCAVLSLTVSLTTPAGATGPGSCIPGTVWDYYQWQYGYQTWRHGPDVKSGWTESTGFAEVNIGHWSPAGGQALQHTWWSPYEHHSVGHDICNDE
jgi:hypothetical protein